MNTEEQNIVALQLHYLQKNHLLSHLLNKFQCQPCFQLAGGQVRVDMDNVTFGPQVHSVRARGVENKRMRVVYYCILYYLLENQGETESDVIYERVLRYIIGNDMSLWTVQTFIPDEQAKTYMIKLLFSLLRKKGAGFIVQQFSKIPQFDKLMINFMQSVTETKEIVINSTCYLVEELVRRKLGLGLEFVGGEYVILQNRYVVEVREDCGGCCFTIRGEDKEGIDRIREESSIRETAFFPCEELSLKNLRVDNAPRGKVQKMNTAKSIDISEGNSQKSLEFYQKSIRIDSPRQSESYIEESTERKGRKNTILRTAFEQFDALINSSRGNCIDKNDGGNHIEKQEEQNTINENIQYFDPIVDSQMKKLLFSGTKIREQEQEDIPFTINLQLPKIKIKEKKNSISGISINHTLLYDLKNQEENGRMGQLNTDRTQKKHATMSAKNDRVPSFIRNRVKRKDSQNSLNSSICPRRIQPLVFQQPKTPKVRIHYPPFPSRNCQL